MSEGLLGSTSAQEWRRREAARAANKIRAIFIMGIRNFVLKSMGKEAEVTP
jgi:hypothetical protein